MFFQDNMQRIKEKYKGDVTDMIILLISIFFLAIAMIVVAYTNNIMKNVITETTLGNTSVASSITNQMDSITTSGIQKGFVMIFGFLVIGMMLSAFLVRVHPAFLFLYIIFAIVTVFVSVFLANAYAAVVNAEELAAIASQQTMITFVMKNIVKILIGAIALSIVILFAKSPDGAGGGTPV